MKVLKSGDDVTYSIGGKNLILSPMPWGKLKKVFALVSDSASAISGDLTNDPSRFMKWVSDLLINQADDFLIMLFDKQKNEFLDKDWIDQNITLMQIQQIISDAIIVNGVTDFLAKRGGIVTAKASVNDNKPAMAN